VMAQKAEQLKFDLIEKVAARVRDRLDRERAGPAERFLRAFYANVPPDDILRQSPDNLYGAALRRVERRRLARNLPDAGLSQHLRGRHRLRAAAPD